MKKHGFEIALILLILLAAAAFPAIASMTGPAPHPSVSDVNARNAKKAAARSSSADSAGETVSSDTSKKVKTAEAEASPEDPLLYSIDVPVYPPGSAADTQYASEVPRGYAVDRHKSGSIGGGSAVMTWQVPEIITTYTWEEYTEETTEVPEETASGNSSSSGSSSGSSSSSSSSSSSGSSSSSSSGSSSMGSSSSSSSSSTGWSTAKYAVNTSDNTFHRTSCAYVKDNHDSPDIIPTTLSREELNRLYSACSECQPMAGSE